MSQTFMTTSTRTLAVDRLSYSRKLVLLLIFFVANFLSIFSRAALLPAIPTLEKSLHITQSQSTWLLNAQQLGFASFLLIGGRISDIYNTIFVVGVFSFGIFSLCVGFTNNVIAMITLIALIGIASAMSIPSAIALLVRVFPEPLEQARAIGVFGACTSFGDVIGNLLGATIVQKASYHWVFWSIPIVAAPAALGSLFLIPPEVATSKASHSARDAKWKSLDLIGVLILTVAPILFMYALTSGPIDGWATAGVLAPLIISISNFAGFFYWETLIPYEMAAIPPRTWFYKNFFVLFCAASFPVFWSSATALSFTTLFQDGFRWSVISSSVHLLPSAVAGGLMSLTGGLSMVVNPKWIIISGFTMAAVATVLFALDGGLQENYWLYVFPSLIIGGAGAALTLVHTHIAMLRAAPASIAGIVGTIIYGAASFGSVIGVAAFNAIQTSVDSTVRTSNSFDGPGRADAFWFLSGIAMFGFFSIACFYDRKPLRTNNDDQRFNISVDSDATNEVEAGEMMTKNELDCSQV